MRAAFCSFCPSSEVTAFLAAVAKIKWEVCEPGSRVGVKMLREAIKHQSLHVRMLDKGSTAKKGAFVFPVRFRHR